ncbi:hypothetical protein, partial [Xenorhabdus bovienii]|uniref:hypothetical protein n=1 Tax=Xenorhabdus bovienii TaxID=40576 RepID=UPI00056EE2FD
MAKESMIYSLSQSADLIIGQFFKITVGLISNEIISQSASVLFSNINNITVQTTPINFNISTDRKKAEAIVDISVKDTINDGDLITFNIDTNMAGFETGKFICTARKIDPESLVLTVDNQFLDLPTGPNDPSIIGSSCTPNSGSTFCTKVHTILIDPHGKKLSGVPVLISENRTGNFDKFHIYDAEKKTQIEVKKFNDYDQIIINSDENGNVIFYLYSQESLSAVLNIISMIQGVTLSYYATSSVYAISSNIQSLNYLRWPNIEGFWSGNLISHGPDKFKVMITRYDNAQNNDVIIFYVNGKRTPYIININDVNEDLGKYSHELPYDIFEYGGQSAFSYVVVTLGGDIMPSYPTNLVYMGGAIPEPDPDVKRDYYPCIVYTSAGSVIPENTFINYDSIRRYPANNINSKTG